MKYTLDKMLTTKSSVCIVLIVYVVSFMSSFCANKSYIANINTFLYNEENIVHVQEDEDLTATKAFERFKHIAINNENVIILNYIGALSCGLSSVVQTAFNGFTFGSYIGVYSNYMSLNTILKYTLPHSFELIAVIFSGGEGLYFGISLFLCLLGHRRVRDVNFMKLATLFIVYTFIIVFAAFVEAYITMSL